MLAAPPPHGTELCDRKGSVVHAHRVADLAEVIVTVPHRNAVRPPYCIAGGAAVPCTTVLLVRAVRWCTICRMAGCNFPYYQLRMICLPSDPYKPAGTSNPYKPVRNPQKMWY